MWIFKTFMEVILKLTIDNENLNKVFEKIAIFYNDIL